VRLGESLVALGRASEAEPILRQALTSAVNSPFHWCDGNWAKKRWESVCWRPDGVPRQTNSWREPSPISNTTPGRDSSMPIVNSISAGKVF
jgi:hypothetical protein